MKIDILTLFPEMFSGIVNASILKRAQDKKLVLIASHNLRDWATDKHRTVDDRPYGGGPGMVIKVDVVDHALHDLKLGVKDKKSKVSKKQKSSLQKTHLVLLTPQGKPFSQTVAQKLAQKTHLILIAGHYEGFDERIRTLVDEEISIGDYILTGGELPAMVIVDAVTRLLPGVLGKDVSSREESFSIQGIRDQGSGISRRLLEYPHYTRPETYLPISISRKRPLVVPTVLKNGHHAEIFNWRSQQALQRTHKRRPDLLER